MKSDKRIDEIFRNGLHDVDLPTPPAQDWAAMARAAKRGAVLAGKGGSSAMSVRWIRILGGAVVVATACYLAFGPNDAGHGPRSVLATAAPTALLPGPSSAADQAETTSPNARLEAMGQTETLMASPAPAADNASASSSVAGQEAVRTTVPAPSSGHTANAQAHDAVPTRSNRSTEADTRSLGSDDRNTAMGAEHGVPVSLALTTTSDAIPDPVAEGPASSHSAQGARGPDQGSGTTVNEEVRDEVGMIAVLRPLPAPLSYLPNAPLAMDVNEYLSFARWSIAPWLSIGHSVYSDPDHGSGIPEGLDAGNDLPVNVGLRAQYAIDRRLAFFTGITFAQKGGLSGTVTSSPSLRTDYQLSGSYLEVPMALKFIWPLGNKDLYARAGLSLQFNMPNGTSKVTVHDEGQKEMSTLVLAGGSMGTALDIGIGAQFRLGHRLCFFIEPSYQYGLSPVVKHPTFDLLPYNPRIHTFSLATGLSIQLDR